MPVLGRCNLRSCWHPPWPCPLPVSLPEGGALYEDITPFQVLPSPVQICAKHVVARRVQGQCKSLGVYGSWVRGRRRSRPSSPGRLVPAIPVNRPAELALLVVVGIIASMPDTRPKPDARRAGATQCGAKWLARQRLTPHTECG